MIRKPFAELVRVFAFLVIEAIKLKNGLRIIRLLLDHGADPNKRYQTTSWGLPFSILGKGNEILIDAFTGGVTPLMLAAALGFNSTTEILLQYGADSTVRSQGKEKSYTAEALAIAYGHQKLAEKIRAYRKR